MNGQKTVRPEAGVKNNRSRQSVRAADATELRETGQPEERRCAARDPIAASLREGGARENFTSRGCNDCAVVHYTRYGCLEYSNILDSARLRDSVPCARAFRDPRTAVGIPKGVRPTALFGGSRWRG